MRLTTLQRFSDRLLGRGSAAITVPVMDGALKPNRALDDAQVVASLEGIDDLACDGVHVYASAGQELYRLRGGDWVDVMRMDAPITALALSGDGCVALALQGRSIEVRRLSDGAWLAELRSLDGQPLQSVNALAFETDAQLLFTDGSTRHAPAQWCHDLMD